MKSENGTKPSLKSSKEAKGSVTPEEEAAGHWLCEDGPYLDYITSLCGSNPGLKQRDPANKDHPLRVGQAVVYLLDSPANGPPDFQNTQFRDAKDLKRYFNGTSDNHDRRRIYIMEGLAQDYVAVIGGHFFMDPSFFQRQERTCVWSNEFTPTSDALPQPSLLNPKKSFHLQYCELRQFETIMKNEPFFCHRTGRHVGMTPPRHAEESTTGILRRKVSWWCRTTTGGGWDVVILCDPQLDDLWNPQKKEKTKPGKNRAFQNGYVDFLCPQDPARVLSKPQHPHKSMLIDLCHYIEHHADLIPEEQWNDPHTSSFFLKKIVAAHYLQLIDYIKAMLPSLELRLTTAWVEEQDQWKSLQTISRRCGNYRDDIEDTLLSLGYPLKDLESSNAIGDWMDDKLDFQYIYFRLKILKQRADNLMQAMTGLASIAGNRQNLEEAKRVKRLNLLALLFIPLAYTSSLFSMSEKFAPGAGKFWIYWVSAILALAVTFLTTYILDTALGDDAQWRIPFKFWGEKEDKTKPKPKRTGTGFFDKSVYRG
ncbi:hypothetical protein BCR34DRAFT_498565 [Clohesyomyces aquaticus]|uniref:Cora-like Mg2+ transporter protein-domain-containing protein n=1 Tax=Clohesyomyces aquaticus TaxID=1231657 RepID=A0A1Y1YBF2_9PLEO|nr:hypothetical protein BCR34DRAFT_498565 [Clohesyomyces aquaticus]